jgi:hypothetical protein
MGRVPPLDAQIGDTGGLEAIETLEQRERLFSRGAVLDRGAKQPSGHFGLAALKGVRTRVNELLALALTFGNRAARALDVRPRTGVTAIDEQGPRPDVDRQIVLTGKVVIEPAQEQLFEARFAIVLRIESRGRGKRVLIGGHEYRSKRSRRRL